MWSRNVWSSLYRLGFFFFFISQDLLFSNVVIGKKRNDELKNKENKEKNKVSERGVQR